MRSHNNWVTGKKEDLWQAFLFAPADEWADVIIPMNRFLKTWRGRVLEIHQQMNQSKVLTLGGGGGAKLSTPA